MYFQFATKSKIFSSDEHDELDKNVANAKTYGFQPWIPSQNGFGQLGIVVGAGAQHSFQRKSLNLGSLNDTLGIGFQWATTKPTLLKMLFLGGRDFVA